MRLRLDSHSLRWADGDIKQLAPSHNGDFDRLLIAQAMVEGVATLARGATVARYPGPVL